MTKKHTLFDDIGVVAKIDYPSLLIGVVIGLVLGLKHRYVALGPTLVFRGSASPNGRTALSRTRSGQARPDRQPANAATGPSRVPPHYCHAGRRPTRTVKCSSEPSSAVPLPYAHRFL
jgi:hypothetical protein